MKCQSLFSGEKKKKNSKCCLLEVFHSMLGVKGFQVYFCHPTVLITITNKKKQQQTNKKQINFNASYKKDFLFYIIVFTLSIRTLKLLSITILYFIKVCSTIC